MSLIGASVMLGYLRNYLREIYGSDLTAKEKRLAHHEAVNHPYIHKIIERKIIRIHCFVCNKCTYKYVSQ